MAGELIPFGGGGELEELPRGNYLTSYRRDVLADQMAMVRAVQGRDFGLDELENEEIVVEHVVCHWAQTVDPETGEVSDSVRTILVGPDGTRYATRSETVRRDVARVAVMLNRPLPFSPPLRFRVRRVKNLAGSRKYLTLEILGEAVSNGNGTGASAMARDDSPPADTGKARRRSKPKDFGDGHALPQGDGLPD